MCIPRGALFLFKKSLLLNEKQKFAHRNHKNSQNPDFLVRIQKCVHRGGGLDQKHRDLVNQQETETRIQQTEQ